MSNDYLIKDKKTLEEYIENDRKACLGNKKITLETKYRCSFKYKAFCYLRTLRNMEYVCYLRDSSKGISSKLLSLRVKMLDRKKNKLSRELGLEIPANHIKSGVRIYHPNVILNGYAEEGCIFHGNNVLGNKKTGAADEVPHLGKNVDVGIGAMVIGNVEIADNCVIGAGAVVTKSFTVPGTVIVGVPAREIKK